MALTLLLSCQGPALKIHHYPGRLLASSRAAYRLEAPHFSILDTASHLRFCSAIRSFFASTLCSSEMVSV